MAQPVLSLTTIDVGMSDWEQAINNNFTDIEDWLIDNPLPIYALDDTASGFAHPDAASFPNSLYFVKSNDRWGLWFTGESTGENFRLKQATWPIKQHTANFDVESEHAGMLLHNFAATGSVQFNLPAASDARSEFTFYAMDTDSLTVDADGTDTIRVGSSVSAAGGNISTSGTLGVSATLVSISSTEWVAINTVGSWTVT